MKESIEKNMEEKKNTMTRLEEIKKKEIEKSKKEPFLGGTPWGGIEPKHLTEECKDIFSKYISYIDDGKDDLDSAQAQLESARKKIEEMKEEEKKRSNEQFINWIDDMIGSEIDKKRNQENMDKDNAR
ncbi:MAG: hypothetical protein GF387_00845 [Candidatus Portnoybacteria bacterium]|nr:hypothetical protein [Candidatus Portnoybacteria bacterium]